MYHWRRRAVHPVQLREVKMHGSTKLFLGLLVFSIVYVAFGQHLLPHLPRASIGLITLTSFVVFVSALAQDYGKPPTEQKNLLVAVVSFILLISTGTIWLA